MAEAQQVMSFFEPARLLWGLLAGLVIIAYWVRRRRVEHSLSTVLLWQQALAMRSRWRRWRKAVSIALGLAIVFCLTLALADPYRTAAFNNRTHVVIVIDNSPGMSASDREPSRFKQSADRAKRFARELGRHDRAGLLSTAGPTRVLCGLTENHERIDELLQTVELQNTDSSLSETIALARGMLQGRHNPQVVVFSDSAHVAGDPLFKANNITWVPKLGSGEPIGVTRSKDLSRGLFNSPAGQSLWIPLAGIALVMIVVQWFTNQRRLTV